ncbi:von Willebrand factor type A domain-containing protein [bacterium]|nr:von Willebrand factor type A domain-containing protein [bacterium]
MNQPKPGNALPRELEARVVAYLLGEASDFEQDEIAKLLSEKPSLDAFQNRMNRLGLMIRTASLIEETATESDLSEEQVLKIRQVLSEAAPVNAEYLGVETESTEDWSALQLSEDRRRDILALCEIHDPESKQVSRKPISPEPISSGRHLAGRLGERLVGSSLGSLRRFGLFFLRDGKSSQWNRQVGASVHGFIKMVRQRPVRTTVLSALACGLVILFVNGEPLVYREMASATSRPSDASAWFAGEEEESADSAMLSEIYSNSEYPPQEFGYPSVAAENMEADMGIEMELQAEGGLAENLPLAGGYDQSGAAPTTPSLSQPLPPSGGSGGGLGGGGGFGGGESSIITDQESAAAITRSTRSDDPQDDQFSRDYSGLADEGRLSGNFSQQQRGESSLEASKGARPNRSSSGSGKAVMQGVESLSIDADRDRFSDAKTRRLSERDFADNSLALNSPQQGFNLMQKEMSETKLGFRNNSDESEGLFDSSLNDGLAQSQQEPEGQNSLKKNQQLKRQRSGTKPSSGVRESRSRNSRLLAREKAGPELADEALPPQSELLDRDRFVSQAPELNELNAAQEAFSTFSLHVGDVSFKLAQAALRSGQWPDAERIRIEEFVNAFDYGDPMPSQREKVACQVEQAIHPFLQQRNLLRISMRTAALGRAKTTPLKLTLVIDNSGSMERMDRQQTLRKAFSVLTDQLQAADEVTLISFAMQPRLLADRVSGGQAKDLVNLIHNLPSEGGTNLEAALQLAVEKAKEQFSDSAQNRIILMTDGAVNLGDADPSRLANLVLGMRASGIAFDAAGIIADGLNDEVLETLTRKGDGRYYLLDSGESADEGFARQIAGALRPAAKDVKVQVEFNPDRVEMYKLLGFEKHRLKKEDFRNDRVDAAEMAAAEAGVALYQVQVRPDGSGDLGSVSVRFKDLSSGLMVEKRWPMTFDPEAARPDEASSSMKIAMVSSLLAMKLKSDDFAELVDLRTLAKLIASLSGDVQSLARVASLKEMIEQARGMIGQ